MPMIFKESTGLDFDWGAVDASAPLRGVLSGINKAAIDKSIREEAQAEKDKLFAFNVAKAEIADEFALKSFNEQVATREAGDIHRAKVLENQATLASNTNIYQNKVLDNQAVVDAAAITAAKEKQDLLHTEVWQKDIRKSQEIEAAAKIAKDEELTAKQNRTAKQITIDADKQKKKYADKAAEIAGLSYDEQQTYLNSSNNDPTEKLAVRKLWKSDPSLYGEANNNNNYSVENQGTVDKFGKEGVPTLADEKTYSRLSKDIMSSESSISNKALKTAKEVIPDIDKVVPWYDIHEEIGILANKLGYEPGALNTVSSHVQQVGNYWGNVIGKNTRLKTNNDTQVVLLAQMIDSLPENSPDRIQAEELLYEAKETSLALGKGRGTISAAQINRRLKKKQYGLSATTRNTRDNTKQTALDKALSVIKGSKLTPEEVAKALVK